MNALAAWRHVLLAPWQQRRNTGSLWMLSVVPLMGGLPILVGWLSHKPNAFRLGAAIGLAMIVVGAWVLLLLSVLTQNQPASARLVPAHPARLRQVLFGAWLALSLVSSLAVAGTGALLPW